MAFLKYAKASLVRSAVSPDMWGTVLSQSTRSNFNTRQGSKVVLEKYDPKQYLLSHCTIIASVDTEVVNKPLGKQIVNSFQIDRKYPDWSVPLKSQPFINNNADGWERKLLLSSFPTFTGGENYLEHIQIPEMSKGKIVDAAARNIGDSIYVDILVATDRKFTDLINAIVSKRLQTLSMGCTVSFTICTKCGNVAEDETQLCPDIKYSKGNFFYDELGRKLRIAELCGHIDAEPGSVKFIEASWVGVPAFTGAVVRSFLSPMDIKDLDKKMMASLAQPPRPIGSGLVKTAQEKNDLSKAVDDLAGDIRDRAVQKVREEMDPPSTGGVNDENESIIRSSLKHPEWRKLAQHVLASTKDRVTARKTFLGLVLHKNGGWAGVVKSGQFKGREILAVSQILDRLTSRSFRAGEAKAYRTVLAVGSLSAFPSTEAYLTACGRVLGHSPTPEERTFLIDKGRLFDLGS